jgi:hypothetical protein
MDAYERVLGAAMEGDATLFAREDYVEEAWRDRRSGVEGRHSLVYPVRTRILGDRLKVEQVTPQAAGAIRSAMRRRPCQIGLT